MDKHPVLPPIYFLVSLILMAGLHRWLPARQLLQSPYRYAGLAVMFCGFYLAGWSARLFRQAGTTVRPFEESSELVLHGPYRWTRNPMYVSLTAILIGTALLLGSLTPFAVPPAFVIFIDRLFVRREERMLERAFGAAYVDYKSRVRRWI